MIRSSFLVFITFLTTWSPLAILLLSHVEEFVPPWLYIYASMLAHSNSALNFLIYFLKNRIFRNALLKKFGIQEQTRVGETTFDLELKDRKTRPHGCKQKITPTKETAL